MSISTKNDNRYKLGQKITSISKVSNIFHIVFSLFSCEETQTQSFFELTRSLGKKEEKVLGMLLLPTGTCMHRELTF